MRPNGGEIMLKIEQKFAQRIGNVLQACLWMGSNWVNDSELAARRSRPTAKQTFCYTSHSFLASVNLDKIISEFIIFSLTKQDHRKLYVISVWGISQKISKHGQQICTRIFSQLFFVFLWIFWRKRKKHYWCKSWLSKTSYIWSYASAMDGWYFMKEPLLQLQPLMSCWMRGSPRLFIFFIFTQPLLFSLSSKYIQSNTIPLICNTLFAFPPPIFYTWYSLCWWYYRNCWCEIRRALIKFKHWNIVSMFCVKG